MFAGLNRYLGNYIGEFVGELGLNVFFLLSALAMRKTPAFPRWVSWLGLATAVLGLAGMFRNVTAAVSAIGEVNNYLLPLWMVVFGWALIRYGRRPEPAETQ